MSAGTSAADDNDWIKYLSIIIREIRYHSDHSCNEKMLEKGH